MRPARVIRVAVRAVLSNKLHSTLTTLGIVVGVGAVVSVMSIGNGSRAMIREQTERVGANLIFVRPVTTSAGQMGQIGSITSLTFEDAQALVSGAAPDIVAVAAEVTAFAQVRTSGGSIAAMVIGTTPSYESVRNFTVAEGRFLSTEDLANSSAVAVLGSRVSVELFGGVSPLGQTVFLNRRPFHVVGLLERGTDSDLRTRDDLIVAPLTTVQARLATQITDRGTPSVELISVQAGGPDRLNEAQTQIQRILRQRHGLLGIDDFVLTSQNDIVEARTEVRTLLTIFLASIAGISLFAGGIGIMNMMLVSTNQRGREIGLRKAVGAKERDILNQFLTEAVLLSITGGALGVGVGMAAAELLELLSFRGEEVRTLVSVPIVLLSLLVAVGTGIVFGVYPALHAAHVNPVQALRHE